MLTELQTRKLTRRFNLGDLDQDGLLESADFNRYVHRAAVQQGWTEDSDEYQALHTHMMNWWNGLQEVADPNRDGRVSLPEWLTFHERLLSTPDLFESVIGEVVTNDIRTYDRNGDGALDAGDYQLFFESLDISDADAAAVFAELDQNGDGLVTRDEMLQHVRDFFLSDDPAAPGSGMLGPY